MGEVLLIWKERGNEIIKNTAPKEEKKGEEKVEHRIGGKI